mmetsp:Transcript_12751/g.19254  ORF Transcript_12751/g.19254 Transcript_12751/m.19254 type:complete len:450 (-) Transcript_12751:1379-2728(-)
MKYRLPSNKMRVLFLIMSFFVAGKSFPTHLAPSLFRTTPQVRRSFQLMHSTTEENSVSAAAQTTTCSSSAISKNISQLSKEIGGNGRALIAWDFYRLGIDPELFFGDPSGALDEDARNEIIKLLPSKRQTQVLGNGALRELSKVNPDGGVEMGIASLSDIHTSSDGTTKLLLKMKDGLEVETVIIPWDDRERSTLCVSSQVGCRQGCTFCATGRMGRLRNLSADEILIQVYFATKICRVSKIFKIDNIVFMGMGEPADNSDAVCTATRILTDRQLFQLSQSKVTVSTVAPDPQSFSLFADAPCVLAWSVHAATDELRKILVPTTRHTMEELREGLVEVLRRRPKRLRTTMLEYVLIDGMNDSLEDAVALAKFSQGIIDAVPQCKVVVNIIPFNDIGHPTYKKPTIDAVLAFQRGLLGNDITAYIRTTRGDDESAACGQLATSKRTKPVP